MWALVLIIWSGCTSCSKSPVVISGFSSLNNCKAAGNSSRTDYVAAFFCVEVK